MSELRREYTLFIDESGQFGEEALADERSKEQPSSQICGVLVPGVYEKRKRGDDLPPALLSLFPKGQEKHAVDMSHADRAKLLEKVIKTAKRSDWRLVRLVNNSGLGEGELIQTYTRMVAELIVCIYQKLRDERPNEQAVIHLTYAQVLLGKRIEGREYYFARHEVSREMRFQGSPIMIPILEYQEAVTRELEIDLRYGLGFTRDETSLVLGKIIEESARVHPALQLSDLVSNGSYKRGRALRHYPHVRTQLFDFMEAYDFELHPFKAQHQAEDLANHRALGQAIVLVLNHMTQNKLSDDALHRLEETLTELIEDLAEEHSAEQRSDLTAILDSIEDMVQRIRDASLAEEMMEAAERLVFTPLERSMISLHGEADLSWVRYRALHLALANANHSGQLQLAKLRREQLLDMRSQVNDRWELIPLVMDAQLNIAVSFSEELDYQHALEISEEVCGFYHDLSSMLSLFRGQSLLSPSLKMRGHANALEVTLQLERYLCAQRLSIGEPISDLIERGRQLGVEAIEQTHSREELMRVHQQLAHLEALGTQFSRAWHHLYSGLDGDPPLNGSLELSELRENCLMALDDLKDEVLVFPLFHTLRLCCEEFDSSPSDELQSFARAIVKWVKTRADDLICGAIDDYPAHAILRAWARLNAFLGDEAASIGALRVLDTLVDKAPKALSLGMVRICARIEVAITLAKVEQQPFSKRVHSLISGDDGHLMNRMIQKQAHQLRLALGQDAKLLAWIERLADLTKSWSSSHYHPKHSDELLRVAESYVG